MKYLGSILLMAGTQLCVMAQPPIFGQPDQTIRGLQHRIGILEAALAEKEKTLPACLNIENHGCVPYDINPYFDNGPIINSLIARLGKDIYVPLFIPGRAYGIQTTIHVPNTCTAFRMIGTGRSQFIPNTAPAPLHGMQSRFIWTGEPGGTMLRIECTGACVDGIALWGGPQVGDNRAGVGLMIAKGEGIGTGKLWAPQLTVGNCDTGIRFGSPEGPLHNCDMSRIQQLAVDQCRIGVHNAHGQAVSNCVGQAFVRNTEVAFFIEGGRFSVDSVDVLASVNTLVKIGNADGALLHRFSNVQVDAPASNTILLDATATWRPALIVFDQLYYGPDKREQPVFLLRECTQLTIRDSNWLSNGMVTLKGRPGTSTAAVRLDGCKFRINQHPRNFIDPTTSTAPYYCSWTGCHDYFGTPHEDGHVEKQ